ncbi:Phosphorylated CTD interacting factor 1 WW domain containing protein, putative [Trypanosoma equiperdum]|uniref:PCIF1 WW domain-containing protein n=3 Tax=Trypanozoon TaxID=39700 RepID=Q57YM3_TRYB2|nr:hypothetical protein, conserved [Trypanosoma brucei gambiense DAL972]XP_847452.1 hypothetical protein, conserved [Trypanosoma brucei brucei TREU927]AAX69335.1 hypothetical protein, conserved [Trypanosoma brucei]SCU70920.1 Phosphorylated CTD interacting factor 1 WW domain containing protein, putative [Trypanosoma equiperdum]AAZ13386.1 hypothetical protein, conserved [Trypanosoma brucei brucei TREU927]CBH13690.1 hypothetical protein, conserved [Trypanosoma brucei gambiense DAL972]|eukprot:XP_011775966.1 hypothetical protein, conserved [Trypanosoma brucei gambiense DAL972]
MKRGSDGCGPDASHPSLCFHREVLTCLQWSVIRRDFLEKLRFTPLLRFAEPNKLWRHSNEALGKWILSQVARDTSNGMTSNDIIASTSSSCITPSLSCAMSSFFPSDDALSRGTYDEQLIRDLSMKCTTPSNQETIKCITQLVKEFNLAERCKRATSEVQRQMANVTLSSVCVPVIRTIAANDEKNRTAVQRRIQGAIATIDVVWSRNIPRDARSGCPQVSIPLAAYKKLDMSYRQFGGKSDEEKYPRLSYEKCFTLRAATLALRYECCLATGSLQLCADLRLKQHLHANGYRVIDLCASPINAYMGEPKEGSYLVGESRAEEKSSSEVNDSFIGCENTPNHFCSAFPDTDCYFGSLGSVLKFDVVQAYNTPQINPDKRPLLLTLDVPYDEDLCERIFLKLVSDMKRVETELATMEGSVNTDLVVADYVLVLPLWWEVPLEIKKRLFSCPNGSGEEASATGNIEGKEDEEEVLKRVIRERSALLKEGHVLPYEWPVKLAAAAGEKWPCFDGVFVGGSYEYFCTITNKRLSGVTATEVIGLEQPRSVRGGNSLPSLRTSLDSFYGRQVTAAGR